MKKSDLPAGYNTYIIAGVANRCQMCYLAASALKT